MIEKGNLTSNGLATFLLIEESEGWVLLLQSNDYQEWDSKLTGTDP